LAKQELPSGIPVSPGVELKLLRPEDSDALFALTDANRARLREWLPWLDYVRQPSDSRGFIETAVARHAASEELTLGLFVEGRLAGVIGTHAIDWANRKTTLGYWIGSEFEGRGLIAASCAVLLGVLFDRLGLNRVGIHCAAGNPRSQGVAKRLRFREEGILRDAEWLHDHFVDHAVFSMLGPEWR